MRRAEQILDCQTPGCERACAACVLTTDAPNGKDDLDRTVALPFFRVHLVFPEDLGSDDRFAEGTVLSLEPLARSTATPARRAIELDDHSARPVRIDPAKYRIAARPQQRNEPL
jgi:hypothetical protein